MSARLFRRAPLSVAAAVLALALVAGCKKEESAPSPPLDKGSGAGAKAPASPGEALFAQKGCIRCHSAGGGTAGGPPGKRMGPDLSQVGADPTHTPEWFATYIRDPHGQNPGSKMPKHDETKISEQEMDTLIKYLSSLK